LQPIQTIFPWGITMRRFSTTRRRLMLAAPGLLLISCGGTSTAFSAGDQRMQRAVSQLDDYAERALASSGVPGMAIAAVHHDRILHLKGYGLRKAGNTDLVDGDTVFQIASLSKPIASTVMAGLAGRGLIGWDDPLSKHDSTFKLSDAEATRLLTLRDLFCHRSGLADHAGDLLEDIGTAREDILFRLRYLPIDGRFRKLYAYTNFGLSAAAFAAARSAGATWEDLAERQLFKPAGMRTASYRHADYIMRGNRAWLHVEVNGRFVANYERNPDEQSPAGGASASVADLARWLQLQLGNGMLDGQRLIAAEALRGTRSAQIETVPAALSPSGRADYYALGWGYNLDSQGRQQNDHSGAFALGASTCVRMAPDQDLGIVVLTNGAPVGLPEAVAATFMELALDGAVSQDWLALFSKGVRALEEAERKGPTDYSVPPLQPQPGRPASNYAGRYENPFYGEISVVEQTGKLYLLLGPGRTSYLMQHWNANQFVFQPAGENAVETSGIFFTVGAGDRQAGRVRIEYLDQKGEGDFVRLAG
jgi:CubicO group peptidase (beta-lactamase class C family)